MRLTAAGITKAEADLKAMVDRVRNLTEAMEVGALDIKTLINTAFRNSQDPSTGEAWATLAASTIERRRKGKGGERSSKPLIDKSNLIKSIHAKGNERSITYGANETYAAFHQYGSKMPKGRPPKRAFLPTSFDPGTPAGKVIERIRRRILNFITTGSPKL